MTIRKGKFLFFFGLFFGIVFTLFIRCEMKRVQDLKTSQIKISNEAPGTYLELSPKDDVELVHEHGFFKVTEDSIIIRYTSEFGNFDTIMAR